MSSANRDSFHSAFWTLKPLFLFLTLLQWLGVAVSTMWRRSDESGHHRLVPKPTEKVFNISLLRIPFIRLRKLPSIPRLLRVFIIKVYLSVVFSASIRITVCFFSSIILIWWVTLIDFFFLSNQPCIPRILLLVMRYYSFYILLCLIC